MANQFEGALICSTTNCGYIYNPAKGDRKGKIPAGTRFEDLPEEWRCPVCGASKKAFKPMSEVEGEQEK